MLGLNVSPQGNLRARLSSWAKCITRNDPIRANTRFAPRITKLARQTSGQPPVIVTPPLDATGLAKPCCRASSANTLSSPGAVAKNISKSVSMASLYPQPPKTARSYSAAKGTRPWPIAAAFLITPRSAACTCSKSLFGRINCSFIYRERSIST